MLWEIVSESRILYTTNCGSASRAFDQEADTVLVTRIARRLTMVSLIASRLVVKNCRTRTRVLSSNIVFDTHPSPVPPCLYTLYIMLSSLCFALLLPLSVLSHPLTLAHEVSVVPVPVPL